MSEVTKELCNERVTHILDRIDDRYSTIENSISDIKIEINEIKSKIDSHIENNQENYALIVRLGKDVYETDGLKKKVENQEKIWVRVSAIAATISANSGIVFSAVFHLLF